MADPPPAPALPASTPSPPHSPPPPPKRTLSSTLPPPSDLHPLLRRFNHQVHHIQRIRTPAPHRLDFSAAPPTTFRPELLRCNLERCYLHLVKGAVRAADEVQRLRSWEDPVRTGTWAVGWAVAWGSRVGAGPAGVVLAAGLVVSPSLRGVAFPPRVGGAKTSTTVPAEESSLTPGNTTDPTKPHEAEQAAQEFAEDVARLAKVAATPEPDRPSAQSTRPADPLATSSDDETLAPIEAALEVDLASEEKQQKVDRLAKIGLPLQAFTGDLADGAERWEFALGPRAPFPHDEARVKLGMILVLVAAALVVVPPALLQKVVMAVVGLAFFGGPAIERGLEMLDKAKPKWREALELRNSLLKGVPSNVQYVVTLLRMGEQAGMPIPPPPPPTTPPVSRAPSGPVQTQTATTADAADKLHTSPSDDAFPAEKEAPVIVPAKPAKKSKFKLADLVKGAAAITEHAAGVAAGNRSIDWEGMSRVVVDEMKRRTGSNIPEIFMAAVPASGPLARENNYTFFGHYRGRPGHLVLREPPKVEEVGDKAEGFVGSWTLEFVSIWTTKKKSTVMGAGSGPPPPLPSRRASGASVLSTATTNEPTPLDTSMPAKPAKSDKATLKVSIPLDGLVSLRKTTGLGWKSRLAAGWVAGVDSLGDGIVVGWVGEPGMLEGGEGGEVRGLAEAAFAGIVRRDELFNRLVGVAGGRFECC